MNMDFGTNKTPIEVIIIDLMERGTYFRDIYSGISCKWDRKPLAEFDELKNVDKKLFLITL